MSDSALIFDRALKARQQASASDSFVRDHAANHLVDLLHEDIVEPIAQATLLSPNNTLAANLKNRIETLNVPSNTLINDDDTLSLEGTYDAIIGCLELHWVNNVPAVLVQLREHLNDRGLLLLTFLGGHTLTELRHATRDAETSLRGGVSPRVSPMIDVKDAGRLLQHAGYQLPVAASHHLTARYTHVRELMRELKEMGEQSAFIKRPQGLITPAFIEAANDAYIRDEEGKLPATFEFITLTGWKS